MVVADASVTSDRQFQLISVTAERWVPVVEVPEERVREYLLGQRRRGYHLLGLEQTANSSPIHKIKLPERLVRRCCTCLIPCKRFCFAPGAANSGLVLQKSTKTHTWLDDTVLSIAADSCFLCIRARSQ